MATISTLTVAIVGDSSRYDRTIQTSRQQAQQFASTVSAAFRSTRTPAEQLAISQGRLGAAFRAGRMDADLYGRSMRKVQQELRDTASEQSALRKIGGMAGMALGIGSTAAVAMLAVDTVKRLAGGIADAGIHAVQLAADFEQAEIQFETLYKSQQKSKVLMAELKGFAAATPFETTDLRDAAVRLAAFGVAAEQQLPTMRMLGDLSLGNAGKLMQLAETYGKARIQGRAYTRDVNEFVTAGVGLWNALAKSQGVSNERIHAMVEEGRIKFPEIQRALLSLTEGSGAFAGGLEKQSQSLTGLWSTAKDNTVLSLAEIGESLVKELDLKGVTKDLIKFTGHIQKDTIPQIKDMIGALRDMGGAVAKADSWFGGPITGAKALGAAFSATQSAIESTQLALARLAGNTVLAETIEGIRYEREHPRPTAEPTQRKLEIEDGGDAAEAEEAAQRAKEHATAVDKTTAALRNELVPVGKSVIRRKSKPGGGVDLARRWSRMAVLRVGLVVSGALGREFR
ncbi:MAG TPA: tape measure protein, partial [Pirellulales bacterium]|nr:tape measure protein [Pirellulales bacterium]